MLLLLPSHAAMLEEVSVFAHPGTGGTGMKVPGKEAKILIPLSGAAAIL